MVGLKIPPPTKPSSLGIYGWIFFLYFAVRTYHILSELVVGLDDMSVGVYDTKGKLHDYGPS